MRKPVQIAFAEYADTENNVNGSLVALCNDGTIWLLDRPWTQGFEWTEIESIPQPEGNQ